MLEEFVRKAVPPIKRFPVFDCVPVTSRALEVFDALLIPIFPAELMPVVADVMREPMPDTVDCSWVVEIYPREPSPVTVELI